MSGVVLLTAKVWINKRNFIVIQENHQAIIVNNIGMITVCGRETFL
jgi:hypothetical protein